MTGLETGLLVTVAVETIIIGVVLFKKHLKDEVVRLEPNRDRLKVDYFWLNEEEVREGTDPTFDDLIKSEEDFIYLVEGAEILVSKRESFIVTSETGAVDRASVMRVGAIRPPSHWRRPPATLMAVEISVVS